jgi:hypothetical protein
VILVGKSCGMVSVFVMMVYGGGIRINGGD